MTEVFVIRNQLGHYWGKSKTWVDGTEARAVMRAKHRDEAVNTLVELSSKDFELRGEIVAAELSERGEPMVEASEIPLALEPESEEPSAAPTPAAIDSEAETHASSEPQTAGAVQGVDTATEEEPARS
jgi:hypothetical protein